MFANKFACGASIVRNVHGKDDIVIQGDVADPLAVLLCDTWGVKMDSIQFIEPKK
jgi:translation initiation factor 1 (eIF-1/SUI1)